MRRILFFTGAGISAESGISTFRDNEDGLWTKYNPDVVANMASFEENKQLVFKFYNERRVEMEHVTPNKAHVEIGKLQQQYGTDSVINFTQNIDDLFEKAGCLDVKHVHGKINEMRCLDNPNHMYNVGYGLTSSDDTCPECGGSVKPGVIFFGESAPMYQQMFHTFRGATKDDLIVVIGTSGSVIRLDSLVGSSYVKQGGHRILCNKDSNDWIPYESFDTLLFGQATEQIDIIVTMSHDWMSSATRYTPT
jgi:NAD-dependent deacetylase